MRYKPLVHITCVFCKECVPGFNIFTPVGRPTLETISPCCGSPSKRRWSRMLYSKVAP